LEKRPISTATKESIINEIEDHAVMHGRTTREISTNELGELVLEKLYEVDKVAYIRFASVYKHFESLEEFIEEVNKLEGKNGQ